jgi:hypothetical protein
VGGTRPTPPESNEVEVEAAAEAVWALMEEAETAPVTVVEEVEPWSGTHRYSAQEEHSPRAPPVEEPA